MTLIKKRDVPNYLAARRLKGSSIQLVPAIQPDATGVSEKDTLPPETNPPAFNQDFIVDHSSSRAPLKSAGHSNATKEPQAPAFGSVQE